MNDVCKVINIDIAVEQDITHYDEEFIHDMVRERILFVMNSLPLNLLSIVNIKIFSW